MTVDWTGSFGATTTDLTFTYDGSAKTVTLTGGQTIGGVQSLEIISGTGNDNVRITKAPPNTGYPYDGHVYLLHGGDGTDTLTYDGNSQADGALLQPGPSGDYYGEIDERVIYDHFEKLNITLGAVDGGANIFTAPLLLGAKVTLDGGAGNDVLVVHEPTRANLMTFDATGAVLVTNISGLTVKNFERYELNLGDGSNLVTLGSGNDWVLGGSGNDTVSGGAGNDSIQGGLGVNSLTGGEGDDVIWSSTGADTVDGGSGNDSIKAYGWTHGGAGNDTIAMQWSAHSDFVYGDEGDDKITAAATGNVIAGGSGADTLTGGSFDDYLISGDMTGKAYPDAVPVDDAGLEHDVLSGGGGNDALAIGYGDDADGGDGIDTLRLSLAGLPHGIDFDTSGIVSGQPYTLGGGVIQNIETLLSLRGTEFDDTLRLATQSTILIVNAGAGNDTIISQFSSVSVLGGAGDDRFVSGPAADTFDGGAGNDIVDYSTGAVGQWINLGLNAGSGGDVLINVESILGSAFNDSLTGDAGANIIEGGAGDDVLDGAGGIDTASYATAASAVVVSLALQGVAQNTKGAGVDTLTGFENLTGSAFNDHLIGDGNANLLMGGAGDDTLESGGGADTLDGGAGNDVFISQFSSVSVLGGAGDDRFISGPAADTFDGGAGNDVVDYSTGAVGQWVNLGLNAGSGGDVLINVESILGSAFNDTLTGDAGPNTIEGGAGNDVLDGAGGVNTLSYYHATAGVTVDLTLAGPQNTGGAGVDTLSHFQNIVGSAYGDTLRAGPGAHTVQAGAGADLVYIDTGASGSYDGGAGGDTLSFAKATQGVTASLATTAVQATGIGSMSFANFEAIVGTAYADRLTGSAVANTLTGGGGADTLAGGAGADVFRYLQAADSTVAATDVINDFQHGIDKINLTAVRTGAADTYAISTVGTNTQLDVDLHGDGTIDMRITLVGKSVLTSTDLVW